MNWYLYVWSDNYEEWQMKRESYSSRVTAIEEGLKLNQMGVPFVGIANKPNEASEIFMICSDEKLYHTKDNGYS